MLGIARAPIVAVAEVERVDVPFRRWVLVANDLQRQFVCRTDLRATALAQVEGRVLIDLGRGRVVHNVAHFEVLVLVP